MRMPETSLSLFEKNLKRWSLFTPTGAAKLAMAAATNQPAPPSLKAEEALAWFQEIVKAKPNLNLLFVYGLEDGVYYPPIKEWLRKNPSHAAVFFEEDLQSLKRLFQTELGSEIVEDRQVWVQYYDEKETPSQEMEKLLTNFIFSNPYAVVGTPFYRQTRSGILGRLEKRITHIISTLNAFAYEYVGGSGHFYYNFFKNLMQLPRAYVGSGLWGKFAGIPAIICGAGPSLEKSAPLLRTLHNRALIFAGGTALNALNALHVRSHFGVGIDPHAGHVTRLLMNQEFEIPFFYRSRMFPGALHYAHGDRLFLAGSGGYRTPDWFSEKLGLKTVEMEEGNNVTNFSVAIAEALGCSPIICVGVDLAYSDNKPYPEGIPRHALHPSIQEFRSKNFGEELLTKPDIYGNPVATLWKWVIESLWFTQFSLSHPACQLVNATEGGIGFELVPNIPLAEAASNWLTQEYDLDEKIHQAIQSCTPPHTISLPKILTVSREFLAEMIHARKICDEIIEQINRELEQPEEKKTEEKTIEQAVTPEMKKTIDNLSASIGYQYLLQVFDAAYMHVKQRDFFRLAIDKDKISKEAGVRTLLELLLRKYVFFRDTLLLNADILEKEIEEAEAYPLDESVSESYPQPAIADNEPGTVVRRYPNGHVHSIHRTKEGVRDGLQEYFYPNGGRKALIPYAQGLLHGTVRLYHTGERPEREIEFCQGQRQGIERHWNAWGMLIIEAKYDHDRPVEYSRQWHANGNMAKEILFNDKSIPIQTREWEVNGSEIDQEKKVSDYIDQVNEMTKTLTSSLQGVAREVQHVMETTNTQENFAQDVQELQEALQELQRLEAAMVYEAGSDPEHPKEAFWKSPTNQEVVKNSLQEFSQGLQAQMKHIEKHLLSLAKNLQKEKKPPGSSDMSSRESGK